MRRLLRLSSISLTVLLFLGTFPEGTVHAASSWAPTLLVNTESFQQIDLGDGSTNIELRFGASTQTIKFLTTNKFQFSHAISILGTISGSSLNVDRNATVGGTLTASGAITTKGSFSGKTLHLNSNATIGGALSATGSITTKGGLSGQTLHVTGNAVVRGALSASGAIRTDSGLTLNDVAGTNNAILNFGNTSGVQSISFVNALQKFRFTKGIGVVGTISGSSLNVDRNATVGGTLTASGAITTKGALSGSTLTVDGNLTLHGVTYTMPSAVGAAGTYLKDAAGNGTLSWANSAVANSSGNLISLHPEYPNSVYFSSGANLVGQLLASGSTALNQNYYHWSSSRATIQDYWIAVRVRLPDNFSAWDPIKPVEVVVRTSDTTTTNNHVTIRMKDTANALVALTGSGNTAMTSFTNTTFESKRIRGPESTGTWTPKGYFTLYIKLASLTGKYAEIGYLNFNYETTTP